METFAGRLKELREEMGITKDELAKRTGFSGAAITRWEKGTTIPNIDTLVVFAKFFKCSAGYLVGLED